MMKDATHDYSRHTDEEISDAISALSFEEQPLRARSLARELDSRRIRAAKKLEEKAASVAVAKGAGFGELEKRAARRVFWTLFAYYFVVTFVFGLVLGFLSSLVATIATHLSGASESGYAGLQKTIYLVASLVLSIPLTRYLLDLLTRTTVAGYKVRFLRADNPDAA
jgi:uncharacterized membrane protein